MSYENCELLELPLSSLRHFILPDYDNSHILHGDYGSPVSLATSSSSSSYDSASTSTTPEFEPIPSKSKGNIVSLPSTKSKPKKQYQCPQCLKVFNRPSALQTHSYTHTSEKPFKCSYLNCGRSFSVVSNLRRHLKVHQKPSVSSKLSSEDRLRCVRQLMKHSEALLSNNKKQRSIEPAEPQLVLPELLPQPQPSQQQRQMLDSFLQPLFPQPTFRHDNYQQNCYILSAIHQDYQQSTFDPPSLQEPKDLNQNPAFTLPNENLFLNSQFL